MTKILARRRSTPFMVHSNPVVGMCCVFFMLWKIWWKPQIQRSHFSKYFCLFYCQTLFISLLKMSFRLSWHFEGRCGKSENLFSLSHYWSEFRLKSHHHHHKRLIQSKPSQEAIIWRRYLLGGGQRPSWFIVILLWENVLCLFYAVKKYDGNPKFNGLIFKIFLSILLKLYK